MIKIVTLDRLDDYGADARDIDWEVILKKYNLKEIAQYIDKLDTETAHARQDELYRVIIRKYVPKDVIDSLGPLMLEDYEDNVCRWYA